MGRVLMQQPGTTTAKALTETLPKNVIIVDEDLKELRLHDGVTPGGKLLGQSAGSGVPIGTIIPFAGNSVPQGYLLCDGSAISRTDYASLFAVIGTIYGAGDGNSTFNLPNDPYNRRVVEEQYPNVDNSYTWYRLYNDGFVEQGGVIGTNSTSNQDYRINLPIPMDSTGYYANRQIERTITGSYGLGWDYIGLGNTTYTNHRTQTQLIITHASNSFYNEDIWEVKGFSTHKRHIEKNIIKYI